MTTTIDRRVQAGNIVVDLTEAQKRVLHDALWSAAERMLSRKGKELRTTDTHIYRENLNTLRKLRDLGLIDGVRLTPLGLDAAWHLWHTERPETINADGTGYEHAETPMIAIQRQRDDEARRERQYQADVKRAAHLWRGLKMPNAHWRTGRKAVASHIKQDFETASFRNRFDLDLEDLIHLGEQIEAMRG